MLVNHLVQNLQFQHRLSAGHIFFSWLIFSITNVLITFIKELQQKIITRGFSVGVFFLVMFSLPAPNELYEGPSLLSHDQ